MRDRVAVLALLVLLLTGCATGAPTDQGSAGPSTTAGREPTTAPPTTRNGATPAARPAPPGVIAEQRRQAAPDLRVTSFDGRTVSRGGFRGQPVVVNFFESW
jgi:hypothetical protein